MVRSKTMPGATGPTGPVQNLTIVYKSTTEIGIQWKAPSPLNGTLDGYNVYRAATKLTATPAVATFYNDSGLQFGTMYTYAVKAVVNNTETAGAQISDTTHPSTATPVQNLTITGATVSSLSLTWDAPVQTGGNFNGYTIYRGSTKCNVSPTYTSSYTDTGLTANTAYTYTVKVVVDNAEQSSASVSGATVAASTGTRSAVYYPFSSDSPWNLPVVQNAATYDQPILRSVGPGVNYTS